jgi:hypothetical protein
MLSEVLANIQVCTRSSRIAQASTTAGNTTTHHMHAPGHAAAAGASKHCSGFLKLAASVATGSAGVMASNGLLLQLQCNKVNRQLLVLCCGAAKPGQQLVQSPAAA